MNSMVKAVGVLAALAVGVGAAAVAFNEPSVTVERVIDGDTISVRNGDKLETIRLLNIDAPETKDPTRPTECLGPEAAAFLVQRLPVGTPVRLEYDTERTDRFGRTLAGVYHSGKLVNAEIAAAGLGAPVLYEPNRRFHAEVVEAARAAEAQQVGAYAATEECTLPAQVAALVARSPAASSTAPADGLTMAAIDAQILTVDHYLNELLTMRALLDDHGTTQNPSLLGFYSGHRLRQMHVDLERATDRARNRRQGLGIARQALIEQERLARESNEQRLREEEQRSAAEAQAAADALQQVQTTGRTVRRAPTTQPPAAGSRTSTSSPRVASRPATKAPEAPRSTSSTQSGSNDNSGYTGPRCYAPGGKTWKPC